MDKEKQIEEMEKQIEEMAKVMCGGCHNGKECMRCLCADWYSAETLYEQGYRKIPEGSVVLTEEDMKKYAEDCIAGQETGLDIINGLIARAERKAERARKQAVKEVLEEVYKHASGEWWYKLAEKFGVEL